MASRKRYRLDQVAVEAGEVRRGKWSFAKGGRQAPVRGNEHVYAVTDGNLAGRNKWEFLVRVPDDSDGRGGDPSSDHAAGPDVEGADLSLAPVPEGHQGRCARQTLRQSLPRGAAHRDARRKTRAAREPRT